MNKYLRTIFQLCSNILDRRPRPPASGHYLKDRYGIEEKPEGWNDAVLGHFHGGPERREPSNDFLAAFHERAKVPPPKALTPWPKKGRWW